MHTHKRTPIRVTSGSHVGPVQWYYCTTNKVRRKKAREPVVHAQSLPVPLMSLPVRDASCDVISGHATDVTSGHVTDVTSGSTTSHHLCKSGLSCTHILLVLSVCGSLYASNMKFVIGGLRFNSVFSSLGHVICVILVCTWQRKPHNTSNISENTRTNGCVLNDGAPHEFKMAGKGQMTSERASSQKIIRL